MKWEIANLGDLATFINGFPFKPSDWSEEGMEIIRIQNLTKGSSETNYYKGMIPDKYKIKKGDILISWSATLDIFVWEGKDAWLNQHIFKVVFDKIDIDRQFFIYLIKFVLDDMKKEVHGATMQHITKGRFDNLKVPLPPLPIQKRIAEILDAADALRRKDQELVRKYDELAQAIFIDMFGDPVKNEKGWEVKSVIDYCDCIVPGRDKPKSFTGTIPWVTTDDLKHLGITTGSKKSIGLSQFEIKEVKAKVIPPQSVIMTCVGDLGVVSVNNSEIVINQQLHAFQCGEKMNPFFLMYNLSYQEDYMYKMASSTTVPYMNKTVCNSIPVICPPIELQEIFAKRIENIWIQEGLFERNHSDQLFDSLLQQAFKGELVK